MGMLKKIFGGKADPETIEKATSLCKAAAAGEVEKVRTTLQSDPRLVSCRDKDGATALHWAVGNGRRDVVELLLAGHADVNAKTNKGWTPLHWSAHYGRKDMVNLLLANKADVEAPTDSGWRPLHCAADEGRKDAVEALLANKAEVDARADDGRTPLRVAANSGRQAVAEVLLANHADVNSRDKGNLTPLHAAAASGHQTVAALLVAHNAEIDAKCKNGFTPLHMAAFNGSSAVTEFLLAQKADMNAKNKAGMTALQMAVQKGHKDVEKVLLAKGAKAGCSTCGGDQMTTVSLRELQSVDRFSGNLLLCRSCKRMFCDSSILLDDKRTIQSVAALVKSANQGGQVSVPSSIFLKAEPDPPRTAVYRCILGRAYQSEAGKDFLKDFLLFSILIRNTLIRGSITDRLIIEVDGYSDDKREIWQIPELASFFYMLHVEAGFPAIAFWLTADSLKLFMCAAAAGVPLDQRTQILQLSAAMAEVMQQAKLAGGPAGGGSEELQLIRWLLTESVSKTESFWKAALKGKDDVVQRIMDESELTKMLRVLMVGRGPAGQ